MESGAVRLLIVTATEPYRNAILFGDLTLPIELAHGIETLTTLSFEMQEVGVLGCISSTVYNETLGAGFRVIGSGLSTPFSPDSILKLIADFCPTHLILQIPDQTLLSWAIKNRILTGVLLTQEALRSQLNRGWETTRLVGLLGDPGVSWVASQGLSTAHQLQQYGVDPHRLIPWNWPHLIEKTMSAARQLDIAERPLRLLYIGPFVSSKGVGDLLIAVAQLRSRGVKTTLKLVGTGETARFRTQAARLHLESSVEFVESFPKRGFDSLFDESDILVIPSRHEYPETNLNLVNDGIAARIPIVASDHPLFAGRLHHSIDAMIFPAGNARALAHRLERLTSQPQLYAQLSSSTDWDDEGTVLVPWSNVITQWFSDRAAQWLADHSLASGRYGALPLVYSQRSA